MRFRTILRFIGEGTGVDTLGRPLQTDDDMREVPVGEMLLLATDDCDVAFCERNNWNVHGERALSPGQRDIFNGMRATFAAFEPIRVEVAVIAD